MFRDDISPRYWHLSGIRFISVVFYCFSLIFNSFWNISKRHLKRYGLHETFVFTWPSILSCPVVLKVGDFNRADLNILYCPKIFIFQPDRTKYLYLFDFVRFISVNGRKSVPASIFSSEDLVAQCYLCCWSHRCAVLSGISWELLNKIDCISFLKMVKENQSDL